MLVKIVDHKDAVCWVNPAYVRAVRAKGNGKSMIDLSGSAPIVVRQPVDEVAGLLSLALERCGPDSSRLAALSGDATPTAPTQTDMLTSIIVIGG